MFEWVCSLCGFIAGVPRQRDEHQCDVAPSTFYLQCTHFNGMENTHPVETRDVKLAAKTFDDAVIEARRVYAAMPRYNAGAYGNHEEFPKRPCLLFELERTWELIT